jgi:hypothetical protein
MSLRIRRPSPALIVATLAIAIATSGTAFATVATLHNGDTLIARNSLSGNRIRTGTVTGTQMSQLEWGAIILQNNWTNGRRALRAAVDAQGIVHLRGVVRGGNAATIGTLPKTAAPTGTIFLTAHNNAGATIGIILQSNGSIAVQGKLGPDMFVSLDGVTYAR